MTFAEIVRSGRKKWTEPLNLFLITAKQRKLEEKQTDLRAFSKPGIFGRHNF